MQTKTKFHPALMLGAALFGIGILRGCGETPTMRSAYGPSYSPSGTYAYYTPAIEETHAPQWQPQPENTGGGYIHRSISGITVGGDGNGGWYASDSGSGGSVANDGN